MVYTPHNPGKSSWWMAAPANLLTSRFTVAILPTSSNSFTWCADKIPRPLHRSLLPLPSASAVWAPQAQQGGQAAREMESGLWQAYGAAYTLQELLTSNSDDMQGRNAALNAIVKASNSRPVHAGVVQVA